MLSVAIYDRRLQEIESAPSSTCNHVEIAVSISIITIITIINIVNIVTIIYIINILKIIYIISIIKYC